MSSIPDFKHIVENIFNGSGDSVPLVEVQWLDAEDITADWGDKDEVERSAPAHSVSVGYLLHKDKSCVKLVALVNHTHISHGITIPMGMVKKITYLQRKK